MKTVTDARLLVTRAAAAGVGRHVDTTAMFSSLGYLYSLDCLAGLTAINMVKEQTQCIKLLTKSRTDLVVCKTVRMFFPVFRSTLQQGRPNKAGLKCPFVRTRVHLCVRPQTVSWISMKFGM